MNGLFKMQTMVGPDMLSYRFADRRVPLEWVAREVAVPAPGEGATAATEAVPVWVGGDGVILSSGVPLVAVVGCADPVAGWDPQPLCEAAVSVARGGAVPLVTLPGESGVIVAEAVLSAGLPLAVLWDSLSPSAFDDSSRALVRRAIHGGGVVVALSDPREPVAVVAARSVAVARRAWRHLGLLADAGVAVDVPCSVLTAEVVYTLREQGRPVVGLSWERVAHGWCGEVRAATSTRDALTYLLGPLD